MNKTVLKFNEISDLGGEDEERSVEISLGKADLIFEDFIDSFLIPLLKGIGYHEDLIDEYIKGE